MVTMIFGLLIFLGVHSVAAIVGLAACYVFAFHLHARVAGVPAF